MNRATAGCLAPLALAAALTACYATASLLIHHSFHSNAWDLGLMDQVVWNTAHGRWFEYSFREMSYMGDHFQPVLVLMVAFRLAAGVDGLLIAQAAALGAAVIPLFHAVSAMAGRASGWAMAAAYGLSLGVARAVSFDFHPDTFAPLLAFTALWGLASRRPGVFVGAAFGLVFLKEDMVLLTFALCWVAWFAFGARRAALIAGLASLAVAAFANLVVLPHFRGGQTAPLTERYGYLGDSFGEIVLHAATRPGVVLGHLAHWPAMEGALLVLAGVAFLPLLVPRLWPASLPVLLVPMLSQEAAQRNLHLHYMVVPAAAAIVVAAIALRDRPYEGLVSRMGPLARPGDRGQLQPLLAGLAAAAAIAVFVLASPLPPSFGASMDRFDVDGHARAAGSIVAKVPDGVPVSAQSSLVPHLSARRDIYQFPRIENATYVVIDEHGEVAVQAKASGYAECVTALPGLGFEIVAEKDGVSLWRRTADRVIVVSGLQSCR